MAITYSPIIYTISRTSLAFLTDAMTYWLNDTSCSMHKCLNYSKLEVASSVWCVTLHERVVPNPTYCIKRREQLWRNWRGNTCARDVR